jgi:hypothetical protein
MKNQFLLRLGMSVLSAQVADAVEARPFPTAEALYSEVGRKVVTAVDHTVTLIRVRPPALPKAPPPPAPHPLTAEDQSVSDLRAKKDYIMLNLTAIVYLGGKTPVTELRWRDDAGEKVYVAYSNADFRYLSQVDQFETETAIYEWFPFVSECDVSELPVGQKPPVPPDLAFEIGVTEYFLDARAKDVKDQEPILSGLDHLCAYYQINYTALKTGYENREAENEARERELREHPPKTPDATIRWWPLDPAQKSDNR